MDFASSFLNLLQAIAVVMHSPTQTTFVHLKGFFYFQLTS
jgi:hypothetical protein